MEGKKNTTAAYYIYGKKNCLHSLLRTYDMYSCRVGIDSFKNYHTIIAAAVVVVVNRL